MSSILITGATGNVGRAVVQSLMERNIRFRVATRRTEEASEQNVYLDFFQPASLQSALSGIEKILFTFFADCT